MTRFTFHASRFNTRGLTLTELVVASVIVGIAMLGVFAVDYALRSSSNSSKIHLRNIQELSGAMLRLTNAANATSGIRYSTSSGLSQEEAEGIFAVKWPLSRNSICFRSDGNNNPFDGDASESWRCFEQHLAFTCTPTCWQLWTCDLGLPGLLCPEQPSNLVIQLSQASFFNVVREDTLDPFSPIRYIEFNLSSRPQVTADSHPISNPEFSLTTRVYPPGLTQ